MWGLTVRATPLSQHKRDEVRYFISVITVGASESSFCCKYFCCIECTSVSGDTEMFSLSRCKNERLKLQPLPAGTSWVVVVVVVVTAVVVVVVVLRFCQCLHEV